MNLKGNKKQIENFKGKKETSLIKIERKKKLQIMR